MSPLVRRLAVTGSLILLAATAASAGVLLWRHLNPPPVQEAGGPQPLPGGAPPQPAPPELAAGDRRPDFTLPDSTGTPRSVAEWDGKLLFVNFWATWCPPCLEEIPAFVHLQQEYGARGVQFLGVALDSVENVRRFLDEHGVNYPSVHGEQDAIELSKRYGNRIGALPYTVVVGRDGRVLATHHGILDEAEARRLIEQHS